MGGRLVPVMIVACLLLLGVWFCMPYFGTQAQEQKNKGGFASDRDGTGSEKPAPFDQNRAFDYLKQLCAIGPRISGSAGMKKQQDVLEAHFKKLGGQVTWQRFSAKQTSQPKAIDFANLIVTWHPEQKRRVILCTHYDTRPKADQEIDFRKWTDPFVSANDGTAGAAWLMELAHHIKALPLQVGVDFVLFDGEEFIFDGPNPPPGSRDQYFLGSSHFATEYQKKPPGHKYVAAVLQDMTAGKDSVFKIEQNSQILAGALTSDIWRLAESLGVKQFRRELGPHVLDDHLALNRASIPAVDIIDFDYPHWHKLTDLPDQCSPETMAAVAKVLTVWLQRVH
jgi:glutaminyl-peptide cyclotransferase